MTIAAAWLGTANSRTSCWCFVIPLMNREVSSMSVTESQIRGLRLNCCAKRASTCTVGHPSPPKKLIFLLVEVQFFAVGRSGWMPDVNIAISGQPPCLMVNRLNPTMSCHDTSPASQLMPFSAQSSVSSCLATNLFICSWHIINSLIKIMFTYTTTSKKENGSLNIQPQLVNLKNNHWYGDGDIRRFSYWIQILDMCMYKFMRSSESSDEMFTRVFNTGVRNATGRLGWGVQFQCTIAGATPILLLNPYI